MMGRKKKNTIVALILLALLAVAVVLLVLMKKGVFSHKNDQAAENGSDAAGTLPDTHLVAVASDDITRISVDGYDFVKKADGWVVENMSERIPDQAVVDAMAQAITNISVHDEYADVEDLSEYGLSAPYLRITFVAEGTEKSILVGDTSPVGGSRYLMLSDGNGEVSLCGINLEAFEKSAEEIFPEEKATEEATAATETTE